MLENGGYIWYNIKYLVEPIQVLGSLNYAWSNLNQTTNRNAKQFTFLEELGDLCIEKLPKEKRPLNWYNSQKKSAMVSRFSQVLGGKLNSYYGWKVKKINSTVIEDTVFKQ